MRVRPLAPQDDAEWFRMRDALWDGLPATLHETEMAAYRAGGRLAVFVADREDGRLGGFLELGCRSVAEGCASSPVAYVEGWYVDPDLRRTGVGKALVLAAEQHAREQGRHEIASDCELANGVSLAAHRALRYEETVRLIHFRKPLVAAEPPSPQGSAVSIRRAAAYDAHHLIAFDHVAVVDPRRSELIRRGIADGTCFVAVAEVRPVGYVLFDHGFFGHGMIWLVYTSPAERRRGVGSALVRHCESECRMPKLFTSTNTSNTAMRALLATSGFTASGSIDNLDEGDPELVFYKRVPGSTG